MLPMLGVFLAGLILITIFLPNQAWVFLVALVVILVASLFASSMLSRKMQMENINAASKVRDFIGVEKFKTIVDGQEKYIEKFYDDLQKKYEEEDRLAEEANNLDQIEAEANEEAEETTTEEVEADAEAIEANAKDTDKE